MIPCVKDNEKVTFLIRHSERDSEKYGSTDPLNANGRKMARNLGVRLKNFPNFFYMHTDIYRTMETDILIARGKGQNIPDSSSWYKEDDPNTHITRTVLKEASYVKPGKNAQSCGNHWDNGWKSYADMAYNPGSCKDIFYDLDSMRTEIVKKYLNYNVLLNKITIAVSHDQFVAPFVISMTNRSIKDLNFHVTGNDNNWINYLAGAAIIVDNENNVTYVPVRGHNSGYLGKNDPNWTGL